MNPAKTFVPVSGSVSWAAAWAKSKAVKGSIQKYHLTVSGSFPVVSAPLNHLFPPLPEPVPEPVPERSRRQGKARQGSQRSVPSVKQTQVQESNFFISSSFALMQKKQKINGAMFYLQNLHILIFHETKARSWKSSEFLLLRLQLILVSFLPVPPHDQNTCFVTINHEMPGIGADCKSLYISLRGWPGQIGAPCDRVNCQSLWKISKEVYPALVDFSGIDKSGGKHYLAKNFQSVAWHGGSFHKRMLLLSFWLKVF